MKRARVLSGMLVGRSNLERPPPLQRGRKLVLLSISGLRRWPRGGWGPGSLSGCRTVLLVVRHGTDNSHLDTDAAWRLHSRSVWRRVPSCAGAAARVRPHVRFPAWPLWGDKSSAISASGYHKAARKSAQLSLSARLASYDLSRVTSAVSFDEMLGGNAHGQRSTVPGDRFW